MPILAVILAVLSIWDYPARQPHHERLRRAFAQASRAGDTAAMEKTCRGGVKLLPDDPTWQYNLACSLAYFSDRQDEALDALEKAIDLGFRRPEAIAADRDLARLAKLPRFRELVEYAREQSTKPLMIGPMANVAATGIFGKPIALGEQNLTWNFDLGCFEANLRLASASAGGNTGDLYMNRDGAHSPLDATKFPGITVVRLDKEGRDRRLDLDSPNIRFPYPVFGNSSMAYVQESYWRSIPRSLMTMNVGQLPRMMRFYLSNQTWVFPSNFDTPPVGTNGDVCASIAPYWLMTAGRSFSDMPYLTAALEVSRALRKPVKDVLVAKGLLAPTIQVLIRKSLKSVTTEADYLTAAAHPTGLPPNGLDLSRLVASAAKLSAKEIPPLALVSVAAQPVRIPSVTGELTYATSFAWAFVLRAEERERVFFVRAKGAEEFAFVQTHGDTDSVRIERLEPDVAKVTVDRYGLSPTNRVDITVVGRNAGTGWGAPSYVCFARMDPTAPYSDPVLTPQPAQQPQQKK